MNSQAIALLSRLLATARCMSRAAVWLAGALTLASVLLITYDVVVRRVFSVTVGGSDELSSYAFAISTTWALAFTVLERANVRVDVVYQYLPVRVSAVLDLLSLIALGVFAVYLTYFAYDVAMTSWTQNSAANTPLATPLWIPQTLWVAGFAWFAVVLALMLIRASTALVTGDIETLKALCGIRSAQEEADEEAATGARLVNGGRQP
ncbi:TRAP transporter small permease subunit [Pseudomonas matsuisoli]|uniref:TRAP transporter small permease protein n=1 Tax=Pseudomonas matsuisoli TaxID=1515666 RepID=A0A917PXV5_9PSED|nr:TRAP transporter small permease subunit [Pseudomonas matsuisoli]GGJ98257.1 C4-dicarboxylate ABC transporter permease [Pseudomonas matsuisoli]